MAKRSKQKKRTGRTKPRTHSQTLQQKQVSATGTSAWERVRGRGVASWRILLGLCTLLGVPGSLWFFWPDIEISPAILQETSQPTSVMFRVENKGRVALSDIKFHCNIGLDDGFVENLDIEVQFLAVQKLGPKEAATIPCNFVSKGKINLRGAAINTFILYRSWLPFREFMLSLRFVGTLVDGKEWHWLQQPALEEGVFREHTGPVDYALIQRLFLSPTPK